MQIVGMADDPHGACGIGGSIAAAHIVTDLMRPEMGDQIFDQFGGAVAAVAIVSALSPLRINSLTTAKLNLSYHIKVIAGDLFGAIVGIRAKVVQNCLCGLKLPIIHNHLMDTLHQHFSGIALDLDF